MNKELEDALLGLVHGPVWKDSCNHPAAAYIASYECRFDKNWQKIDLYCENLPDEQRFCLRYGDEGHQYFSPGNSESLVHNQDYEPYYKAVQILRSRGKFIWLPSREFETSDLRMRPRVIM